MDTPHLCQAEILKIQIMASSCQSDVFHIVTCNTKYWTVKDINLNQITLTGPTLGLI